MEMEALKIIKIIEKEPIDKGIFSAEMVFPSGNVYPVTVRNPFLEPRAIESDRKAKIRIAWGLTL
jgi:hypothetical protein